MSLTKGHIFCRWPVGPIDLAANLHKQQQQHKNLSFEPELGAITQRRFRVGCTSKKQNKKPNFRSFAEELSTNLTINKYNVFKEDR